MRHVNAGTETSVPRWGRESLRGCPPQGHCLFPGPPTEWWWSPVNSPAFHLLAQPRRYQPTGCRLSSGVILLSLSAFISDLNPVKTLLIMTSSRGIPHPNPPMQICHFQYHCIQPDAAAGKNSHGFDGLTGRFLVRHPHPPPQGHLHIMPYHKANVPETR